MFTVCCTVRALERRGECIVPKVKENPFLLKMIKKEIKVKQR